MKRLLLSLGLLFLSLSILGQNRYFGEVFSSVSVDTDVIYGNNLSVLTGSPVAEDLLMDVYTPVGDTVSSRPVVVVVHHSEFLPVQLNQHCVGTKADYHIVELCTRLAKYGYVVASIDHRLGWNPTGSTQDVRYKTYINAMYRGMQDVRNAIRFFRWSAENGDPYSIDPDKISVVGEGTGAELAVWTGSFDRYEEMDMAKFLDVSTLTPVVDSSLVGDVYGTQTRPLNIANYPTYSSGVSFVGSLGGSVGDSTWIEADEPPVVSMHGLSDPWVPYGFGPIIVGVTGDFLMNASGSKDVQRISNALGNNDVYVSATITDLVTQVADDLNDGHKGLYPFETVGVQNAPWQWWDVCPYNVQGLQTNPDMSELKGQAYIDTIMAYMAPRMAISNGFWDSGVGIEENEGVGLQIYPNPVSDLLRVRTEGVNPIHSVQLMDETGRKIHHKYVNANSIDIDVASLPVGFYLLQVTTNNSLQTSRILVNH